VSIEVNFRDSINSAYKPLLDNDKRYLICYGGAGSGKSYFIAQKLIYRLLTERNHKILIIRKVANTLKNSCYDLIKQTISNYGLNDLFQIYKSEMRIESKLLNSTILFLGLDDVEKLKSITDITSIWLEEATEITEDDFKQVNLRMRGETKYYKQIILSFNPISHLHWIKKYFIDKQDDEISIHKTTYLDNKWIDDQYKRELEKYKDIDKVYYQIYALGEWGVMGNLVFTNYSIDDLSERADSFNTYYYGLDFGFTNDPTAYIKVAYKDGYIYILDEHYEKQLTNDRIAGMLKDKGMTSYIYCDCSEPKSIRELNNYGVQALPVKKGKDSVIHGIQWIRQQKIIIDKRCQNFINEVQSYKYREDKDGNVLNEPVDAHNHLIDALRYALESFMSQSFIRDTVITATDFGL
jgi:phage terminase large subunit